MRLQRRESAAIAPPLSFTDMSHRRAVTFKPRTKISKVVSFTRQPRSPEKEDHEIASTATGSIADVKIKNIASLKTGGVRRRPLQPTWHWSGAARRRVPLSSDSWSRAPFSLCRVCGSREKLANATATHVENSRASVRAELRHVDGTCRCLDAME